jgi:hypothetical protein
VRTSILLAGALTLAIGCSDGGVSPGSDDGAALAAQFEHLADSVDRGGYSPAGEALRHAATIVRLTGHATPVSLTIDNASRSFLAVAEQIDFPNLECSWPVDSGVVDPGDTLIVSDTMLPPHAGGGMAPPEPPECKMVGTFSMRTLIAWEPEQMNEVARIVADIGSNQAEAGVPDVMTGLPTQTGTADSSMPSPTSPPDSGSGTGGGPGGFPGFMGEYLVRDVGSWFAVEGNQTNDLLESGGSCTKDKAEIDWASFSCEAAQFRFEFDMRVEPIRYEPLTGGADPGGGPSGSHTLSVAKSTVDGVRLTWESWTPPILPPVPNDSVIASPPPDSR